MNWDGGVGDDGFSDTASPMKESNMTTLMTYPILRFFDYDHLPSELQAVSKPFHDLAHQAAADLTFSAEVAAGLRKLLEAKDCFVRAAL